VTEMFAKRHCLLLLGRSGLGKTTYFRYLTARLSSGSAHLNPALVPVYIPIGRYFPARKDVRALFHLQIASLGGLTDQQITSQLLESGGFLILIDGLDEVDAEARSNVSAFIDANRANRIIVSSQEPYAELSGIPTTKVPALGSEEIAKLLSSFMEPARARKLLAELPADSLHHYQVPQNVVLAAGLVRERGSLPATEPELYHRLFEPAFSAWAAEGNEGYRELLCRCAFNLVVKRQLRLDGGEPAIPAAIVAWLSAQGMVRKSEQASFFRHDTIRDFLASRYFIDNWKETLDAPETSVAKHWVPMLRLALLDVGDDQERAFIFDKLLEANGDVAGITYREWRKSSVCQAVAWEGVFLRNFGAKTLQAA